MADEAQRLLTEAGILPQVLPSNYTFNKVREILIEIEKSERDKLGEG